MVGEINGIRLSRFAKQKIASLAQEVLELLEPGTSMSGLFSQFSRLILLAVVAGSYVFI